MSSSEVEESDTTSKIDDYHLELSSDPIKFEAVDDVTEVFFDDSKQQVKKKI